MAEFDECRSLNRLLVIERQDMKRYIEVIFTKIKTSPCYSFILEKLEEIKSCIRLYEKVNKAILTNIIKFESLDYFYEIERDNALDFVIDIEEKIAIIAENLTKSSSPSHAREVSVPPIPNPPECAASNNSVGPILNLDMVNTKETPILISEIIDCNIESSLNCKFDDNVDKVPILMHLETRSEHCCNISPKIAEPHINLSSLHNACCSVPDLVSPRKKIWLSWYF